MTFATDNRFQVGGSGRTPPDDAVAAYGARWIDQGDTMPADIPPDRQGFAYDAAAAGRDARDVLIALLVRVDAQGLPKELNYDVTETLYDGTEETLHRFALVMRRTGGYVYVDAWLAAP